MGKTLNDIAKELKSNDKKVQLIYAFNGVGKTRLSKEFKALIAPSTDSEEEVGVEEEISKRKILYYSAFTEDLFYWDNDLENDIEPKLKIHRNDFTKWVLETQGQEDYIIRDFKNYTSEKLEPKFNPDYSEVVFSYKNSADETIDNIKISKGEESNFIWCVFYTVFKQVIEELIEAIDNRDDNDESTSAFEQLEYIYIDDPVTSLDDNHLIQLAVDLAELIKKSNSKNLKLKFIITTHNPLFYNVLHNELSSKDCFLLDKNNEDEFELTPKKGDSNKSFSYHMHLKNIIEQAIKNNQIEKYHFTLLRNLYEKTANFLGYAGFKELLPDDKQLYYNRVIQFTSHSTLTTEIAPEPTNEEKQVVAFLFNHLINNYNYWKEDTDVQS